MVYTNASIQNNTNIDCSYNILAITDDKLFTDYIYESKILVNNSIFIAKLVSKSFERLRIYPKKSSKMPEWGVYCTLIDKRIGEISQNNNDLIRRLKYFPIEKYTVARYLGNQKGMKGYLPYGSFLVTSLGNQGDFEDEGLRLTVSPNGIYGVYPSLISAADAIRDHIIEKENK